MTTKTCKACKEEVDEEEVMALTANQGEVIGYIHLEKEECDKRAWSREVRKWKYIFESSQTPIGMDWNDDEENED